MIFMMFWFFHAPMVHPMPQAGAPSHMTIQVPNCRQGACR